MTYPDQPGNWSDPAGSDQTPVYRDPNAPTSSHGAGYTAPYDPQYTPQYAGPYGVEQPPAGQSAPGYPGPPSYPGAPGYTAYPAYGYPATAGPPTNSLAIASLVCSLAGLLTCGISALVGAILGHVAKRQVRERGEGGAGLATAGIICGWIILGLYVALALLYVALLGAALWGASNATPDPYSS